MLNTNEADSTSNTVTVTFGGKDYTVNEPLETQAKWLLEDLAAANNNSSIKWIIVTMHIGAYATGDHSNGEQVQNIITTFTPIFSAYNVDLVLQAHDHTYSKTLPYKWNAAGYTTTYDNSDVVNFSVATIEYNDETYDLNPNGTYYVTTGAAGHRAGASEGDAGIWSDVYVDADGNIQSLEENMGYLYNKYKVEVGTIQYSNDYDDFSCSGNTLSASNSNGVELESYSLDYTNEGDYNKGDPATGNVNAQMFGILNLTETTLSYDFYTVEGNEVTLFDSLNIMKTDIQ